MTYRSSALRPFTLPLSLSLSIRVWNQKRFGTSLVGNLRIPFQSVLFPIPYTLHPHFPSPSLPPLSLSLSCVKQSIFQGDLSCIELHLVQAISSYHKVCTCTISCDYHWMSCDYHSGAATESFKAWCSQNKRRLHPRLPYRHLCVVINCFLYANYVLLMNFISWRIGRKSARLVRAAALRLADELQKMLQRPSSALVTRCQEG